MADGTLVFDTKLDNTGLTTGLSKVGSVAKGAMGAAVAGVGALAVGVGVVSKKFADATTETAAYGDSIDKMSQKVGMSAQAYQEWDYVMQISGTEMSNMTTGLKTMTNKLDDAKNGGKDAQEMFGKLGLSMEDLSKMSREEVFDAVITGFQGMADSTERAALANDIFGKSGQELTPLFNTTAEDTQKLKDEVNALGGVMSDEAVKASADFQDQMTALKTSMSGLSRNMMAEFLPSITEVMGGLTEIFGGNSDKGLAMISTGVSKLANDIAKAIPQVAQTGAKILEALTTAIIQNLPMLLRTAIDIVKELSNYIIQNLPMLIKVGLEILVELAQGIAQSLPTLIPQVVDVVLEIVDTLLDNIDMLIDAGIELIIGLATGLVDALPKLIEKIPTIVVKIVEALIRNAPKLMDASLKLMLTLGEGLVKAIPQLISKIPQIVTGLVNAVREGAPRMIDAGLNLIRGLGQGISNAKSWLIGKIKELCNNALGAIKSFFGIASPSKKFRWIGEMCVEGMEEGFEDMDNLANGVTASLGNITANVSGGSVGSATNGGIAGAVAEVLEGMGVYMDGRSVGQITASSVNETMGRFVARRV